jgi:hypothetical protein
MKARHLSSAEIAVRFKAGRVEAKTFAYLVRGNLVPTILRIYDRI